MKRDKERVKSDADLDGVAFISMWEGEPIFMFEHVNFEMIFRHPWVCVEEAGGYVSHALSCRGYYYLPSHSLFWSQATYSPINIKLQCDLLRSVLKNSLHLKSCHPT